MRPVPQDLRPCVVTCRTAVAPNPPNGAPPVAQSSVERVLATLGHLTNRLAKPSHKRPTRAQPPRSLEKDDGFRAFEPEGERLVVVAVDYPGRATEQRALPFSPLVLRRSNPARLPVVDVEVNHRQTSPRRERTCERALPGTRHPVDEDALADHPRRTVHGRGVCHWRRADCPLRRERARPGHGCLAASFGCHTLGVVSVVRCLVWRAF